MPVSFMPPAPDPGYAGYLSAYAGGVGRNLPTVAGLYEQAARNAAGVNDGYLQATAALAAGNADRMQAAGLARAGFQQREADRELDRLSLAERMYPTARDAFLAQQQQELQAADLSQRELIRLQRLKQARGEVFAQLGAKRLDEDTAADLLAQITAGVSPLAARQEQQKARLFQEQANEVLRQGAVQAQLSKTMADFMAGGADRMSYTFDTPHGPIRGLFLPKGVDFHPLTLPGSGRQQRPPLSASQVEAMARRRAEDEAGGRDFYDLKNPEEKRALFEKNRKQVEQDYGMSAPAAGPPPAGGANGSPPAGAPALPPPAVRVAAMGDFQEALMTRTDLPPAKRREYVRLAQRYAELSLQGRDDSPEMAAVMAALLAVPPPPVPPTGAAAKTVMTPTANGVRPPAPAGPVVQFE